MPLDHLWAGWRGEYVATADDSTQDGPVVGDKGCVFCRILRSGEPDDETFVLWRDQRTFAILNAYPYTSGHVMVMPLRHVGALSDLADDEADELFRGVRRASAAVDATYRPDGMNVGINLGKAGGAGVPGHLHVHLVPRWSGDTNFMTAVAEARVLPESLSTTWRKLKEQA